MFKWQVYILTQGSCLHTVEHMGYLFPMHSRPVAVGWHGVVIATSGLQGASFLPTPGKFFALFYCCFIIVDKERSPEILVQLNLRLCDILESSIFSSTHIVHLSVIT